jgi:glycosyltransferase involved in cell wall biosynthesis
MRVCLVSNLYGRNARGGAERVVQQEARELARTGHQVTIIAGSARARRYRGPLKRGKRRRPLIVYFRPPNLFFYGQIDRYPYLLRLFWHLIDIFNIGSLRRFQRIVRGERPEAIHTHNLMGLGFLIPRWIRRRGIRHVHTVHDVQLLHPSGLIKPEAKLGPMARLYLRLMRWLMGSPDAVVFPSGFLRQMHEQHGFFPDSRRITLANPAPRIRRRTSHPEPPLQYLFVGQLAEHKGLRLLLDAWEAWPERQRARLTLVGGGALEDEVKERAAALADVEYLGRLEPDELWDQYLRSAFVVVPSLVIENAPAVISESFATGTPVIGAAAGGISELVIDNRTGFTFPAGDQAGLTAALERAAAARPRWPQLSSACLEHAQLAAVGPHVTTLLGLYQDKPV